jgi:N-acyl-D-amino-acid deacylase
VRRLIPLLVTAAALSLACGPRLPRADPHRPLYDVLIRNGTLYDGLGGKPYVGHVAIAGDSIALVGDIEGLKARTEIDATGLAVAPGFINSLSQAAELLLEDGIAESDLRQGVTLEVFGELSMGPMSARMQKERRAMQKDIQFDVPWKTLGGFLDHVQKRGVAVNVASYVATSAVREHVMSEEGKKAAGADLERMKALVAQAMEEGALGLTSALLYVPDAFTDVKELTELAKVAGAYGGIYGLHIRNEGNHIEQALDEVLNIAREAHVPIEIFHLKLSGRDNWPKLDAVVKKIEAARDEGLHITANMYPYTAARTGLDAAMPRWVRAGGFDAWAQRLGDLETREKVKREMRDPKTDWDNFFAAAGPEKMLLVGFKNPKLRPLVGKTLAQVAAARGKSPEDTAMDLVLEDRTRCSVIYFTMSEDVVEKMVALPWVSFGSDEGALAPRGAFLKRMPHPRAYGTFSRLLGKYVREEKALKLEDAIRRMTSFPAQTLRLPRRGVLAAGNFADVVVFDPERIGDRATYEDPHRFSTGVEHVFVNGVQALAHGEATGKLAGRALRGPGYRLPKPVSLRASQKAKTARVQ